MSVHNKVLNINNYTRIIINLLSFILKLLKELILYYFICFYHDTKTHSNVMVIDFAQFLITMEGSNGARKLSVCAQSINMALNIGNHSLLSALFFR